MKRLLKQIEDARLQLDISQEDAHRRTLRHLKSDAQPNRSNWSRAVSGERGLSLDMLQAMAKAVGLKIKVSIDGPIRKQKISGRV